MELGGGGGPWGEGLIPVITQGGSPSVDQLLASPCLLEWSVDVLSAPAVCCALYLATSQEPPAAGAVPFLPPFCRETPCCSCYIRCVLTRQQCGRQYTVLRYSAVAE